MIEQEAMQQVARRVADMGLAEFVGPKPGVPVKFIGDRDYEPLGEMEISYKECLDELAALCNRQFGTPPSRSDWIVRYRQLAVASRLMLEILPPKGQGILLHRLGRTQIIARDFLAGCANIALGRRLGCEIPLRDNLGDGRA